MTPEVLSCPYCNARFALPAAEAGGPRVRCPRCGDSFPHQPGPEAGANGTPPPEPVAAPPQPAPTARASNQTVARIILGGMAAMAALGLGYALYTKDFRRANDRPKGGQDVEVPLARPATRAAPPAELAGLGNLPADCAVVAGLHLAELRRNADGKRLLETLRGGRARPLLLAAQDWTGLRPEEIDHIVLGVSPAGGQPRLFAVVRSVRPYSLQALGRALEPARPKTFRGRPVYTVPVGPVGTGLVYAASDDTLVLCASLLPARLSDLEVLPEKARTGAEGLPRSVRELLSDKLERGNLAWAVGALDEVPFIQDLLAFVNADELRKAAANLKAFSVGLRFQDGITVGAALQTRAEKAARELATLVKGHVPKDAGSLRVIGPDQGWVLVQLRTSPEVLADEIARLVAVGQGTGER